MFVMNGCKSLWFPSGTRKPSSAFQATVVQGVNLRANEKECGVMASPARPEKRQGSVVQETDDRSAGSAEPIYLRHRYHGELGQLLREYYTDVVDQPMPDRLLRLIEQFRQKEQNK
jgi:hypothetical protein